MRGSLIPAAKRLINLTPPINPADLSEANANNYMFLFDNLASGEYMEDGSILARALSNLLAREQAVPNLTLEVKAGVGWFSVNSYVTFAGGNSPSFTAPAANPRIDILVLRSDGALHIISGTEAASPTVPTIPSTDIAIAQVYNVVGQTTIRDNDEQVGGQGYIQYDLRPLFQAPVGASAMPKIGLIERVSGAKTGGPLTDVVNFTGSGRLRAAQIQVDAGATGVSWIITIDGVAYSFVPAATKDLAFNGTGNATNFNVTTVGTATSRIFLDVFFKTSLRIQHMTATGMIQTFVEYERE